MKYKIAYLASCITCPVLILAPEFDTLCLVEAAEKFSKECPTAELIVPKCGKHPYIVCRTSDSKLSAGHFEVYDGGKGHEEAVAAQIAFLKKHFPL